MSDVLADVISVKKVQSTLENLLRTYRGEKAENEQMKEMHGIEYWDSACHTIHDVAAALHILLDGKPADEQDEPLS